MLRITLLPIAMVAALLSLVAPAEAAPKYRQLLTTYQCSAPGVSSFEAQTGFRTKLERVWKRKSRVKASRLVVAIVLPEQSIAELREAGHNYLEGRLARAAFRVGPQKVGPRAVLMLRKTLPDDSAFLLKTWGQMKSFKMEKKGKYRVRVPKMMRFDLRSNLGAIRIKCNLTEGAPARLATIRIKKV